MELNVIAIDIAKQVFQLHWVDAETGCIERRKLRRSQVLTWFANREPALVMMEACGGAHEWGRQLLGMGHQVRLLSPRSVRPFVQRNETDAADAQAIWTAGQQPGVKFVAVKTPAQQVVLSLHRLRAQLMKMRIMQTNELRGLLYEFGVVLPEGHRALLKELPNALWLPASVCPRCSWSACKIRCAESTPWTPTSPASNAAWLNSCATPQHARHSPTSRASV